MQDIEARTLLDVIKIIPDDCYRNPTATGLAYTARTFAIYIAIVAGIRVVALGIIIPLLNGSIGAALGSVAGMSVGGIAVMATLAASASYIAAPAAVRIALPDASPRIYVTASLGITFPFNLIVGIPLYIEIAEYLA